LRPSRVSQHGPGCPPHVGLGGIGRQANPYRRWRPPSPGCTPMDCNHQYQPPTTSTTSTTATTSQPPRSQPPRSLRTSHRPTSAANPRPQALNSDVEEIKGAASLALGHARGLQPPIHIIATTNSTSVQPPIPHHCSHQFHIPPPTPPPNPHRPASTSNPQPQALNSDVEEIKGAASLALGGVACGNLPRFLPSLIGQISAAGAQAPKQQYLLLQVLCARGPHPTPPWLSGAGLVRTCWLLADPPGAPRARPPFPPSEGGHFQSIAGVKFGAVFGITDGLCTAGNLRRRPSSSTCRCFAP
jgi:hypothetical protein